MELARLIEEGQQEVDTDVANAAAQGLEEIPVEKNVILLNLSTFMQSSISCSLVPRTQLRSDSFGEASSTESPGNRVSRRLMCGFG